MEKGLWRSRAIGWVKKERGRILILLAAALLFTGVRLWLGRAEKTAPTGDYAEYERAAVTSVVSDSTERDPASDGGWRGEQLLLAEVKSGRYAGQTLLARNYVGPLYGVPLREGDGAILLISTYAGGDHTATVYEFDRLGALAAVLALFCLVAVLVGRGTGFRSLLGLGITVLCLFCVLLPLLLRGAPTLPTVFLVCVYVAVVSFTILGGIRRKSVCAMLGTIAGAGLALLFGLLAQRLVRVDGLRMSDVEPLLQLRQSGTPLGLRGLLVGGVVISALGAVMDVAMSISSALDEVHAADPTLDARGLFRSGMRIGRDMAGTMTNTLILAFLGSGFPLILYLHSLGLAKYQLWGSAYAATEIIGGISSSIGMILSIPLTAAVSALMLSRRGLRKAAP